MRHGLSGWQRGTSAAKKPSLPSSFSFDAACLLQSPNVQYPTGAAGSGPQHHKHLMARTTLPESIQTTGEPRAPAAAPGCTMQPRSRHMWPGAEAAPGARRKAGARWRPRRASLVHRCLERRAQGSHGAGQHPRGVTAPGMFANAI